jgi:hypothetical protein
LGANIPIIIIDNPRRRCYIVLEMVKLKKVSSIKDGPVFYVGSGSAVDMGPYKGRLERLLKDNKIAIGKKTVNVHVTWTRHKSPHKRKERIVAVGVAVTDDTIIIIIVVEPNSDPDPGGW